MTRAVLTGLAELGGFFELTQPAGTDAVPWSVLLADDPLAARIAAVRGALAAGSGLSVDTVDPKVAVSALQVGLVSRLWSVALAGAVLHRWVPDLSSANLLASPGHGGPVPLALADPTRGYAVTGTEAGAGPGADPDATTTAAEIIARVVVRGSLRDLDDACARVGRTPQRALLSNASSSLVGAARVLATRRPPAGPQAWALARLLLQDPDLRPGGRALGRAGLPTGVGGGMERPEEAFLRGGCCLFDRLPGHGLCPDCVRAEHRPELVTPGH
ncbi:(2Fe-2S)-binding protein [Serinicoccus sp. LYQ131]|uniref:(2Fe-2S)-binding protein n=1 Tax=Serinicoccus sp. LYQ131 TaxID=3378797 RepID=UPI0038525571